MGKVAVKRVYEAPEPSDGTRILVDRIWPRGLTKERAGVDLWLKAVAPSTKLRKWFGHDPARWDQFQADYARELDGNAEAVGQLREEIAKGHTTLVFGAHDSEHNNAVALAAYLQKS